MLELIVLEWAEDDLFETIGYGVATHGLESAQSYAKAIRDRIEWLRVFPGAGPVHETLRGKVRSFRQHRHRIYYSVDATHMTVIRILHVSRDVTRHFE